MTEQEIVEEKSKEDNKKEISHSPIKSEQDKKTRQLEAILNIYTSFNNTIAHVTDMSGRTIAKVSGGQVTKHGRLKANPTIAIFIAKRIVETLNDLGVKSLYIRIRAKTRNPAPGPGAHAIIKSLTRDGFKILNILDTTRFPRGGPKKKGGRRGRRP
jgi:small subunit ribosomal protein S11